MMMQPAFHIGDPDQALHASGCRLLIEISAQSFNYILFKTETGELVLLRQYRLYTTADRSTRDLIDEVIQGDALLQQHAASAVVVYNFPEASLVPESYYNSELNTAITNLVYGEDANECVFGEMVRDQGMYNVYRVPRDIHQLLKEKFSGSQYWHYYTLLLLSPDVAQADRSHVIKAVFYHDKFIAAFYSEGRLQLIQTFNFQTPEDVAYYLLLMAQQLGVPQGSVVLSISGMIDRQSALYTELQKYFQEVFEEGLPARISANGLLEEFPPHYFSPLLKMSLCEL